MVNKHVIHAEEIPANVIAQRGTWVLIGESAYTIGDCVKDGEDHLELVPCPEVWSQPIFRCLDLSAIKYIRAARRTTEPYTHGWPTKGS